MYLRHILTYSAAVSSVSFPCGTAFSSHISSWMTATASLTYAEPSITATQNTQAKDLHDMLQRVINVSLCVRVH